MHLEYMDLFIDSLKNTEIFCNAIGTKPLDYETGISEIISYISEIKKQKKQMFFIGNGGSAAIASHMTADFMKNGGIKTCCLYDSAVTTCMGNDYGYEYVFSKPLALLSSAGDLLVAISSSGNSSNIIKAIEAVKNNGGKVITFSGFKSDNMIKSMGDYNVYVPIEKYGIVESVHNMILQQIVDAILQRDGGI